MKEKYKNNNENKEKDFPPDYEETLKLSHYNYGDASEINYVNSENQEVSAEEMSVAKKQPHQPVSVNMTEKELREQMKRNIKNQIKGQGT